MTQKTCPKGSKMKNGKCTRKKSYNPFKMWGSYVGLVIYPLIILGIFILDDVNQSLASTLFDIFGFPLKILGGGGGGLTGISSAIGIFLFVPPILGFLLGYTIHSIFRRLRK